MIQYNNADEPIQVLDKGFVQLLETMPHSMWGYLDSDYVDNGMTSLDTAIVAAARASYKNELKGYDKDERLLRYLLKNRHDSPIEMVEYQFRIKAPLMVLGHFVRHRTAAINVSSYRYLEAEEDEFYIPDKWRLQSKINKQASMDKLNKPIAEKFDELYQEVTGMCYDAYGWAIRSGIAKEQARLFLPAYALYHTWIWKIDLRNLLHFLNLRTAENAQWETRQYANVMYEIVKQYNPKTIEIYEELGKL